MVSRRCLGGPCGRLLLPVGRGPTSRPSGPWLREELGFPEGAQPEGCFPPSLPHPKQHSPGLCRTGRLPLRPHSLPWECMQSWSHSSLHVLMRPGAAHRGRGPGQQPLPLPPLPLPWSTTLVFLGFPPGAECFASANLTGPLLKYVPPRQKRAAFPVWGQEHPGCARLLLPY